jgi:hypothetical protein
MWATQALRVMGKNMASTTNMLRTKILAATRNLNAELQPILIRNGNPATGRQPVHPAAWLRQQKRAGSKQWYSSAGTHINATFRRYLSSSSAAGSSGSGGTAGTRFFRSSLPSNTARAVSQLTGRAPFASTLRPNLTGGALPRTAGGYAAPGAGRAGGARYFSHTPTAPAQVVQNVSQAMRAFWLSGQRARYDGVGPDGNHRYRAVNAAHEEARIKMETSSRHAPGSFIDFRISPTITALSPLAVAFPFATAEVFGTVVKPKTGAATLNAEGFLDVLSVDFARALKDLASIMTDLKKLAGLGDLPITMENNNSILRVKFPGVDAETVERLCEDVGVSRGLVFQDPDFNASAGVAVALKFPYAPDAKGVLTITSPGGSLRSHNSAASEQMEDAFLDEMEDNPWLSSDDHEGYESMSPPLFSNSGEHCSEDFEGLEGIYRFLEECDKAKGNYAQPV